MNNLFTILYEQILIEELGIPRNVFKELTNYVIEMFKKVKVDGIQRITPQSVPPKIFNIDFSGTSFEHLNQINPRIELFFSQTGSCYFQLYDPIMKYGKPTIKHGVGYIHINLNNTLNSLMIHTLEHEILHFIQAATVTWKINTKQIKPIPLSEYHKYVGLLPSKKYLPPDIDTHGYKISSPTDRKYWKITSRVYGMPIIYKQNNKGVHVEVKYVFSGANEKEAIEKYIKKYNAPGTPDEYIARELKRYAKKRIEHTSRPIEFYTDLLSMLRLMQFSYTMASKYINKKDFFTYFITDKITPNIESIATALNNNKNFKFAKTYLQDFKKLLNRKKPKSGKIIYNLVLKRLYNLFMYKDFENDFEEIKTNINKTLDDIQTGKLNNEITAIKKQSELTNTLSYSDKVELGLVKADFSAPALQLIRGDDWLFEADDNNTDTTELVLSTLGVKEINSKMSNISYYLVPMGYNSIKQIFNTFKKVIADSDPNYAGVFEAVRDGVKIPYRQVYLESSKELFKRIQDHLKEKSKTHTQLPDELYDLLMN